MVLLQLFALLPGVTSVIERSLQPEGDEATAMAGLELIDDLVSLRFIRVYQGFTSPRPRPT